jgi:PleD family two-component response regulator
MNKIVAVLPNTVLDQARRTCNKLSEMIDKKEFKTILTDSDAACSINVGFAEAKKDLPFEHLIKEAESKIEDVCFLSRSEE